MADRTYLTCGLFAASLADSLQEAGIDSKGYNTHSLANDGHLFLVEDMAPNDEIKNRRGLKDFILFFGKVMPMAAASMYASR